MHDMLITNGKIVDGTGGPWFRADLVVDRGTIQQVGRFVPGSLQAKETIDAGGLVVAPGFIDAHSHTDLVVLSDGPADGKILQGVTTEITGKCGLTQAPLNPSTLDGIKQYLSAFSPGGSKLDWKWSSMADWFALVEKKDKATNMAAFVGHGTIRIAVMGFSSRRPDRTEMESMKKLLAESLEAGAPGMSSGLIYPPGCYAGLDELIELGRVLSERGKVYATHLRNEGSALVEAVEEAIAIGEKSGCAVHVSHHKVAGRSNFGLVSTTLAMMEKARHRGVDVTCDVYPYLAGSTLISALLPGWVLEGGPAAMLEKIACKDNRNRIDREIRENFEGWDNLAGEAGWDKIMILSSACHKNCEGKTIQDIAAERAVSEVEALLDLVLKDRGEAMIALFGFDRDDNNLVVSHGLSMIGSDGFAASFSAVPGAGKPHPRTFGTFPRILGRFVREQGVITLENAIWKMTGFPATRFNLQKKGLIKEGFDADLVIFDPATVLDKATYEKPFQKPEGIVHVFLKGKPVVRNSDYPGQAFGSLLRV